jgi:hypothetical protein
LFPRKNMTIACLAFTILVLLVFRTLSMLVVQLHGNDRSCIYYTGAYKIIVLVLTMFDTFLSNFSLSFRMTVLEETRDLLEF